MLTEALFDKLLQLRLPAFRDGLRTQQNHPQYAELSFEERLTLLVDQEYLRRQNNRLPVRYFRTSRLLPQLALARQQGTFHDLLRRLAKIPVLVLDDWLREPLTATQAQDLLEILDDRFGQGSLILATQLPVAEWHVCIPSPTLADALLDRLVHNAHRMTTKLIHKTVQNGRSQTKSMSISPDTPCMGNAFGYSSMPRRTPRAIV